MGLFPMLVPGFAVVQILGVQGQDVQNPVFLSNSAGLPIAVETKVFGIEICEDDWNLNGTLRILHP